MNYKLLPAGLLALALAHSAHAIDLHPLESMQLAAGVYEFDNIFIPVGVTLTFVGEPMEMNLRAEHDIRIAGNLYGPGWSLRLEAGERLMLDGGIIAGNITLTSPASLPSPDGVRTEAQATLCVSGYCDASSAIASKPQFTAGLSLREGAIALLPPQILTLTPAVPEPETWTLLLAGLGLVGWQARRDR